LQAVLDTGCGADPDICRFAGVDDKAYTRATRLCKDNAPMTASRLRSDLSTRLTRGAIEVLRLAVKGSLTHARARQR
jgi:hypothetical protein